MESMYFYKQISGMSHKSIDTIAAEAFDDNESDDHVPSLLRIPGFTRSGRRADRFGVIIFHENMYRNSAKRTSCEQLSGSIQNDFSVEIIDGIVEKFMKRPEFREAESDQQFKEFVSYLRSAPKNHINMMGLPADAFIFSQRYHSPNPETMISQEILKNKFVVAFIKELIAKVEDEKPPKPTFETFINHHQAVPEVSEDKLKSYLMTENKEAIAELLNKINAHPDSALQLSKRLNNKHIVFMYGSEPVPYPPSLISISFELNKVSLLRKLDDSKYLIGFKSALRSNSEQLFKMAFTMYTEANKKDPLLFLIEKGFEFTNLQKKILMKHVIKTTDKELLLMLIKPILYNNSAIDLHEYQKDRGITFLHSILIEGTTELKTFVAENHRIRSPNDIVKFVPVAFPEEEGDNTTTIKDPFWNPEDDLFNPEIKDSNGKIKIRKGWDYLMIAAANNDHLMFNQLLLMGADATKFKKMSEHICKHSGTCLRLLNSLNNRR